MRSINTILALGSIPYVSCKSLWATTPAAWSNVIREAYQVGNGRLGGMPFGPAGAEKVVMNVDSLWSGGPFEAADYNGGNPTEDLSHLLPGIRDWIFENGTGNMSGLIGSDINYGSYQSFGNLSVAIDGVNSTSQYKRSIDLETGIHTTVYTADDGNNYTSNVYCTFPDQVCVYDLTSSGKLPQIAIKLEQALSDPSLINATCGDQQVRLSGLTQRGPPEGMKFDGIAQLITKAESAFCSKTEVGTLVIPAEAGLQKISLVFGAGTNYDQKAGNAESSYSFKGPDPGPSVEKVVSAASAKSEDILREAHIKDYQSLSGSFKLILPDTAGSADVETSKLVSSYSSSGTGDPYLESLLFDLGRHLLITSSRSKSLPPNLQGRWAQGLTTSWGADYHANINMQMNLWGAESTGLGALQVPAFDYMADTWVPRGSEAAKLIYGAKGWVTHNEMNIFGHTAMKVDAKWANYPISGAWMMQHVFDHYSYSQDSTWFEGQGYSLMKGTAEFWLSQLQEDKNFNDGTLIVNPCNSAEHGPTTFACTHYQQIIHQLFTSLLSVSELPTVSADAEFIASIKTTLEKLDTGLHFSSWGSIKEWKLPDTDPNFPFDLEGDTHRHLSHLIGWYPGFSVSSTLGGYTNKTIQDAVRTSLVSRGPGNGPDANAGWEKVWRSACWAMLNDTAQAHFEIRYALEQNFVGNGLSMYEGERQPFQIDANFGLVGAVLAMLAVDLPDNDVVLGPAIPESWSPGQVKGLRLRGGGSVDFEWNEKGIVTAATIVDQGAKRTIVNVAGEVLVSE